MPANGAAPHRGAPESIADAALFLASGQAKNIYGQKLVVDGGYTVG